MLFTVDTVSYDIWESLTRIWWQEKSSEIDRLSYQLRDTVTKKEAQYYEDLLNKTNQLHGQELGETKRKLDGCKRDIVHKVSEYPGAILGNDYRLVAVNYVVYSILNTLESVTLVQ